MARGTCFSEETSTVLVFRDGAVIRLAAPVAVGQLLFLTNKKSNQEVVCQVLKKKSFKANSSYVELVFTEERTDYWGVAFPEGAKSTPEFIVQEQVQAEETTAEPTETPVEPRSAEDVDALKQEVEALREQLALLEKRNVEEAAGKAMAEAQAAREAAAREMAMREASKAMDALEAQSGHGSHEDAHVASSGGSHEGSHESAGKFPRGRRKASAADAECAKGCGRSGAGSGGDVSAGVEVGENAGRTIVGGRSGVGSETGTGSGCGGSAGRRRGRGIVAEAVAGFFADAKEGEGERKSGWGHGDSAGGEIGEDEHGAGDGAERGAGVGVGGRGVVRKMVGTVADGEERGVGEAERGEEAESGEECAGWSCVETCGGGEWRGRCEWRWCGSERECG